MNLSHLNPRNIDDAKAIVRVHGGVAKAHEELDRMIDLRVKGAITLVGMLWAPSKADCETLETAIATVRRAAKG